MDDVAAVLHTAPGELPMLAPLASIDLLLRGGAFVLLVLVAALLLRDYGRVLAARIGALFAIGSAAYAICSASGFHELVGWWAAPVLAAATGNNLVFWLFASALFDDRFRLRAWHGALWIVIVGTALAFGDFFSASVSSNAGIVRHLLGAQAVLFAALAGVKTLSTWREDLVEPRRRLRLFVVLAAAGHTILTAFTGLAANGALAVNTFEAALLLGIAAAVAWSLIRIAGDDALFAPLAQATIEPERQPEPIDSRLVAILEHAMSIERIYRQDGLTIGALAHRQGLPEHRLRRLINQGLGYRNFNAFLNGYRIADAKAALADPSQAGVPILTIALDAGFTSLGPFNRAFKDDTGMTPTEFRRARLGLGEEKIPAESLPRPVSASRISNSARNA